MLFKKLRKLARILECALYRRALRQGVAAGVEHEAFLRTIDCRTVIDVGANRGQFALAARRRFPQAKIVCFEPLTAAVQKLRQVFARDPRVHIHHLGLGARAGRASLHVSAREDNSSLLAISELHTSLYPGTREQSTEDVQVEPLDSLVAAAEIDKPALLKLDVQGYELEVLRGCVKLLPNFSYIYCECSFERFYTGQALAHEITAFLRERGFILSGVYNLGTDREGRAVIADFFFTPLPPETEDLLKRPFSV